MEKETGIAVGEDADHFAVRIPYQEQILLQRLAIHDRQAMELRFACSSDEREKSCVLQFPEQICTDDVQLEVHNGSLYILLPKAG